MQGSDNQYRQVLPFTYYLVIVIILVNVPIIGLISYTSYREAKHELNENILVLQEQTEKSVILSLQMVDTGLKMLDRTYNARMQAGFGPFLEEYERAGRDPAAMDLERVKAEIGGDFDLYIINEDGVVEYTTHEPDLGLDFKEIPYFFEAITELRLGESFSADRVVQELSTGQLRKFAYMPTPDNRYLLELGIVPAAIHSQQSSLTYRSVIQDSIALNPNLKRIRLYNSLGNLVAAAGEELTEEADDTRSIVGMVHREGADYIWFDPETGREYRYLFVNLTDPDHASDMNMVVELTYDTLLITGELKSILFSHLIVGLSAILLTSAAIFLAARHITRPIHTIVEDVETIAEGDLNHTIRAAQSREFSLLEQSINAMVGTLKETIQKLQSSEDRIKEYSEHLEEQVAARTAELQESTRIANLYLDIMTHDINNANNSASLYADTLLSMTGEEEAPYIEKVKKGLQKSAEIMRNVSTIRKIREGGLPLRAIDLDPVIRAEINHHSGIGIKYAGTDACVLADDLLPEIFTNLIGNAAKFIGPGGSIWIRIEDQGADMVQVSVEDNGPGIPDALKNTIFNRFASGGTTRSGRGLGLAICRMLIGRYGGRIWADDRVPGRPEMGAAIRFLLKRSPD